MGKSRRIADACPTLGLTAASLRALVNPADRMAMIKLYLSFFLVALTTFWHGVVLADQVRDGDIIFHTSRSSQSIAIQKATHSKHSHMGIIFFRDGKPYVYEAIKTVRYTPLKEWEARGEGGHYVIKRLANAERILTPQGVAKLWQTAIGFQGKPYDFNFGWSDSRMYCSELVWKIYDRGLGLRLGRLQKLQDFDLTDPVVKSKMKERYGDRIPMEETVISPGEIFSADSLRVVSQK